jgi:hypothetical protein
MIVAHNLHHTTSRANDPNKIHILASFHRRFPANLRMHDPIAQADAKLLKMTFDSHL